MENTQYRVIVAGTRSFKNYALVCKVLDGVFKSVDANNIEIVSGTARGADSMGEWYAKEHNLHLKRFPADWGGYGKGAGPVRNKQMAEYANSCVVFWDGISKGSKNMIDTAKALGLKVLVVNYIANTTERF